MESATASLGSSSIVQSISGALRGRKSSPSAPNSLTPTRRKSRLVVQATSCVDKFSKSDIIVSPSILSANFSKLGEQVKPVELAVCDWIHVDVGRFVLNITIGPLVVDALRPVTDLPLDLHLIKCLGVKAGVVLNPGTPLSAIEYVLDELHRKPSKENMGVVKNMCREGNKPMDRGGWWGRS